MLRDLFAAHNNDEYSNVRTSEIGQFRVEKLLSGRMSVTHVTAAVQVNILLNFQE